MAPRIVIPFIPTLLHLSSVEIALHFYNGFDVETLDEVFTKMKQGNSTLSEKTTEENKEVSRVKESLLIIPAHLRETVVQGVHGLNEAIQNWRMDHHHIFKFKNDHCTLYFRSDGSIDAVETAKNLVRNRKISIRKRFKIACMYCLEKSVLTLWAEMEASGETENLETANNSMTRFWVRWLREGSRVPWLQAARLYLDPPTNVYHHIPIFSVFLPLLRPNERLKFFDTFRFAAFDDFRFCLYAVTEDEEEQIVKGGAFFVLLLHLCWPLQSLFLETAEKLWNNIDDTSFRLLLNLIWDNKKNLKDFDYSELFEGFWNRSPRHLKESVREFSRLKDIIDRHFNEKRIKRRLQND
ncbi:unnamed protein product [Larinioides sclopetarius]|uniref:Uncharacterized protein n=1 Tax=Larinioides sclopetarius TaxID=280406 RepID=A0AAV1YWK3_9ARAC